MATKFLLTHGYFLKDDPKEQVIMKPYVPLGLLYISAFLKQHNKEHEVFDSTFYSIEDLKRKIVSYQPTCIAMYVNLMTRINVLKVIKWMSDNNVTKNIRIILGGPEVKHHAAELLNYGASIICVGEGEQSMLELFEHFENNNNIPNNIDGTIVKIENEVITNKERALLKNINELPAPNRNAIDLNLYLNAWKEKHGYSTISVSTMRGCPYTCKWCSRAVYGGTYRRRSAELVIKELKEIKENYNPDKFWFVDDVFTISHKWLKEFADEIKKTDLKISYEIITRADRMNDEVINLLKQSGCYRVWIGAESGSQKIIDAMDRRVDVQMVRDMIIKTKAAGIEAGTFIMLGYPGETKEDIKETIHHLKTANPSFYTMTVAYPIKGTPLFEETKDQQITSIDWELQTDRDIDFKRLHNKKFYEHALRWVYNEVEFTRTKSFGKKTKLKLKSVLSQGLMIMEAWKN